MQQQASRKKVDLGNCMQMYRAPFLYLPGAPNSLIPALRTTARISGFLCRLTSWKGELVITIM